MYNAGERQERRNTKRNTKIQIYDNTKIHPWISSLRGLLNALQCTLCARPACSLLIIIIKTIVSSLSSSPWPSYHCIALPTRYCNKLNCRFCLWAHFVFEQNLICPCVLENFMSSGPPGIYRVAFRHSLLKCQWRWWYGGSRLLLFGQAGLAVWKWSWW